MCADHYKHPPKIMRDASKVKSTTIKNLGGICNIEDEVGVINPISLSSSNFKKTFSDAQRNRAMKVRLVELTEKSFFPRDLNEYNHSKDICIMEQDLRSELTAANQKSNEAEIKATAKKRKHKPKKNNHSTQNQTSSKGYINKLDGTTSNSNLNSLTSVKANISSSADINNTGHKSNYYNFISPMQSNIIIINPTLQQNHISNVQYCLGEPLFSQQPASHVYKHQSNLYLTNNPIGFFINPAYANPFGNHNHQMQLNHVNFIGAQNFMKTPVFEYNNKLINPSSSSTPHYLTPRSLNIPQFFDSKLKSTNKKGK